MTTKSETTINLRTFPEPAVVHVECGGPHTGAVAILKTAGAFSSNKMYRVDEGAIVHVDSGNFRYYMNVWREELCDECHDLKSDCACAVLVPA